MKDKPEEIEGIPVVDSINYLGVTITDKKNCLTEQKQINIKSYSTEEAAMIFDAAEKIIASKKPKRCIHIFFIS